MSGIALVTGGSRGIGAETCRLLGEAGWSVAVNYRSDEAAAKQVAAKIAAAGGKAITIKADTADPAQVAAMFATVDKELGTLTALVNNAAIAAKPGRFDEVDAATIHRLMAVNVFGYMYCTQEAIRRMATSKGGKGGAIVSVSSGASQGAAPSEALYAASKGAVNSLTLGLSQDLARDGIRINTVSPGLTWTDMPGAERCAATEPSIPIGRAAQPSEIAEGIVWLLSGKASYVVGAYLRIGGGRFG